MASPASLTSGAHSDKRESLKSVQSTDHSMGQKKSEDSTGVRRLQKNKYEATERISNQNKELRPESRDEYAAR